MMPVNTGLGGLFPLGKPVRQDLPILYNEHKNEGR